VRPSGDGGRGAAVFGRRRRPFTLRPPRSGEAGFTLIEALVALGVVAVSLTAIGSVLATSIRATRALGERLALAETARTVLNDLPDRSEIVSGRLSGQSGAHRWQGDVRPFAADFVDPTLPAPWTPQIVAVSVRSPGGRVLRIDTIRLLRGR
jgi:general secretion pathway protein I